MSKYQLMKIGVIPVMDDMHVIAWAFCNGEEDVAFNALRRLDQKINCLWEFRICSLDDMREVKRIVKLWAEKKYRKGYMITLG